MKNMGLYLFLGIIFLSCNDQPQAQAQKTDNLTEQKSVTPDSDIKTTNLENQQNQTTKKQLSRDDYLKKARAMYPDLIDKYPYNVELKDIDGNIVSSDKLLKSGKPTILLFWLTTCAPCQIELAEIHKKYPEWQKEGDFNLYAISTDFEKNYTRFTEKVNNSNWGWDAYNDHKRMFRLLMPGGLNGLPQTFVLNKNGEIVYHKRKYRKGDEDVLFDKVKELF